MAHTDLEPCSAVEFGYVGSFVEAIKLILGADYISHPKVHLLLALALKQVKYLVITLSVEHLFTIVAFHTELLSRKRSRL